MVPGQFLAVCRARASSFMVRGSPAISSIWPRKRLSVAAVLTTSATSSAETNGMGLLTSAKHERMT